MLEPRPNPSVNPRTLSLILAAGGVLLGIAACWSALILLPLCAAAFALLFLFEPRQGRHLSYIAPVLLILACALLFPGRLPMAVFAPLSALLTVFFYKRMLPKFDLTLCLMGLFLLAEALMLWFEAAAAIGTWSPGETIAYYSELLTLEKEALVAQLHTVLLQSLPAGAPDAEALLSIGTMVDRMYSLVLAMYAVLAFFLVGVALKVFSALVRVLGGELSATVMRWRFTTPVVFAYFYIVLFFAYMFFGGGTGVLAMTVGNLYTVFMLMYAYIGWKYLRFMMARSGRVRRFRVLLAVLAVIFFTVALQMLAIEGVIAVITANRLQKRRGGER